MWWMEEDGLGSVIAVGGDEDAAQVGNGKLQRGRVALNPLVRPHYKIPNLDNPTWSNNPLILRVARFN